MRVPTEARAAAAAAALATIVLLVPAPRALGQSAVPLADEPTPVLAAIVIEGNVRTDAAVIRRVIGVEPGEPFDYDAFDEAWDRLEDAGYFAFVDLDMEEGDDGRVTLLVRVEEDQTLAYGPYARYSRRHKILLGGWLRERNLRGKGEVLDVQALAHRIQRLRVTWTRPWLLGRDGLELEAAAAGEQGPFVWRPFDYRTWSAGLRVRQTVAGRWFGEVAGAWSSFAQRDDYAWAAPDRGRGPGAATPYPEATREETLLTAALGYDSRENPFYPRWGLYHRYALEYHLTGDVEDFLVSSGDARVFLDLPTDAILALRAYGRVVDRPVPVEQGLFWGGPETIRGAPYALLEGEEGYLLTAEIRYPLLLMPISPRGENVGFGLHAFFDAGDAWFEGDEPGRALQSFGAGIHLNVATWQLRFEAARERDHDWEFVFMDQFAF